MAPAEKYCVVRGVPIHNAIYRIASKPNLCRGAVPEYARKSNDLGAAGILQNKIQPRRYRLILCNTCTITSLRKAIIHTKTNSYDNSFVLAASDVYNV